MSAPADMGPCDHPAGCDAPPPPRTWWSVPLRSLLPDDDGHREPTVYRAFLGPTAGAAWDAARQWCEDAGDCEVGAVEDVDGPAWAGAVLP